MNKFTPGKWQIQYKRNVVVEDEGVERLIAFASAMSLRDKSDEEAYANARLIAAAPRMYELLKRCMQDDEVDLDPDLEGDILWLFRDIEDPDVQGNELVGG